MEDVTLTQEEVKARAAAEEAQEGRDLRHAARVRSVIISIIDYVRGAEVRGVGVDVASKQSGADNTLTHETEEE